MKLLKEYDAIYDQVIDYFGYDGEWLHLDDRTDCHWFFYGGEAVFGEQPFTEEVMKGGDFYSTELDSDQIWRTDDYTMIYTQYWGSGNKILMIFDNSKEAPNEEHLMQVYEEEWSVSAMTQMVQCYKI